MSRFFITHRRHLFALVALTLIWAFFWWRLWTPTPADRVIFMQDSDFALHYYAPISYQMERFADGELAQWNPYNRAGFPHIAGIQHATFYPPRYLIAAMVPGAWDIETFQWEVAAHLWLASVLMYAFLADIFQRHPRQAGIALFGALLWAYSGFMTGYPILHANILEAAAWLPLILLGVRMALSPERWPSGIAIASTSMALMILAGHPQIALYLVYLVAAYGIFTGWSRGLAWRPILLRGMAVFALGFGLSAVQLLPTLEFMRLSSRVVEQTFAEKALGFDPAHLSDALWPNGGTSWSPLYIGPIALLMAGAAWLNRKREAAFWAGTIVVGLFLSFGGAAIVYALFYTIAPGFSVFRDHERGIMAAVFAAAILAAHGLAWWSASPQMRHVRRFRYAAYGLAALLTLLYLAVQTAQSVGATVTPELLRSFAFTALISGMFAAWLSVERVNSAMIAVLCAIVCIDLLTIGAASPNYLADAPQNRLALDSALTPYITGADDIAWRVDGAAGLQGTGDFFRVPDIYGAGPLSLASVEALYTLPVDRFWEIFGVRYATITDPPPASVALNLVAYGRNRTGQEYQVVELLDPRPLAHLVYDYRFAEGSAEFARQIMADSNINLREQAITIFPLPFELPVTRPEISRVEDVMWDSPERLTMRVSSGADALLTLSVVNYPGWRVTVNGQPAETVDVYAGLLGVPMRAGENQTVELTFQSRSLALGAAVSLAAAAVLLAGWFIAVRRKSA